MISLWGFKSREREGRAWVGVEEVFWNGSMSVFSQADLTLENAI